MVLGRRWELNCFIITWALDIAQVEINLRLFHSFVSYTDWNFSCFVVLLFWRGNNILIIWPRIRFWITVRKLTVLDKGECVSCLCLCEVFFSNHIHLGEFSFVVRSFIVLEKSCCIVSWDKHGRLLCPRPFFLDLQFSFYNLYVRV